MDFVDRLEELEMLSRLLASRDPQFIRISGRRRVGKTELIRTVLEGIDGLYVVADPGEPEVQLRALWRQLSLATKRPLPPDPTWEGLLDEFEKVGKRVVVIDEFQHLIERDLHVAGQIQRRWEGKWRASGPSLVISGSSIGMMQALSRYHAGPFYGRLTRDLNIHPFGYAAVRLLYPRLSEEARITRYAIFGGTPYCHAQSVGKPLKEAVVASLLAKGTPLLDEPANLLLSETREPARYQSILSEVAQGAQSLHDLEDRLHVSPGGLGAYLSVLRRNLELLGLEAPVCGLAKRSHYVLTDPFYRFYYQFIAPHRTSIELGNGDAAWEMMRKDLEGYVGRVFEEVVKEVIRRSTRSPADGTAPPVFSEVGRWWNRTGEEIDVVAKADQEIWAGEVTWSKKPEGEQTVRQLRRKIQLLERTDHKPVRPFLVSRGGVVPGASALLEEQGGFSLDLGELSEMFDAILPVDSPPVRHSDRTTRE